MTEFSFVMILRAGRAGILPVFAAAIAIVPGWGAETEPKTHSLFVGVDISVMEQKQLRPVEDVRAGSFIVHVDGKEAKVSGHWTNLGMKVTPAMKVSMASVAVAKLKFERAYTPENDPAKKFARQQGEQEAIEFEFNSLSNLMYVQSLTGGAGGGGAPAGTPGAGGGTGNPYSGNRGTAASSLPEGGFALQHHFNEMSGRMFDTGTHQASQVGQMQDQIAAELYDAISVDFELTSSTPLRQPYVVIMARFHAKDAAPDHGENWLYAAELDHLDEKPARVHLLKGGFPPGYILESYQIHVYDGRREVVTPLSAQRVDLTRSDAYRYLRADYLAAHKGATTAPQAAMGALSADERVRLGAEAVTRSMFVQVSADGIPGQAYSDREMTRPVDAAIVPLVERTRFFPALDHGHPIDGVAEFKFSKLTL